MPLASILLNRASYSRTRSLRRLAKIATWNHSSPEAPVRKLLARLTNSSTQSHSLLAGFPQISVFLGRHASAFWVLVADWRSRGIYRFANEDGEKFSPLPKNPFASSSSSKKEQTKRDDDDDEEEDEDEKKKKTRVLAFASLVSCALALYLSTSFLNQGPNADVDGGIRFVSWNEFVGEMLSHGEVKQLMVFPESETVLIELYPGAVVKGKPSRSRFYRLKITGVQKFEDKLRKTEQELGIPEHGRVPLIYKRVSDAGNLFFSLAAVGIVLAVIYYVFKGLQSGLSMTMTNFTKAKFTIIDPSKPGTGKLTSFKDVAGMEEAKKEVLEFVDYLKNPTRFKDLGAKAPRGALLLGPPGCGKTLLAKAVAAEANVPFLTMAGSEFVEMIGGLGAARVRDLFTEARKRTPCIVYIDEIDAMGRRRAENNASYGGSGEEEQTLNQLLVEMDGMTTTEGVIMLASTNRDDILDRALLRPGRFDRRIEIDPPTAEERKAIFEVYLSKLTLEKSSEAYSRRLSSLTPGMSGADIANVVNEAALHAAREGQKTVAGPNFDHALERVIFGTEKKSQTVQREERRILAYHESGHALCGWLLEHTDAPMKISIAPRTNSMLGFSQTAPSDQKLYSKEQLFDRMCMALGGRVAELLVFNKATHGAEDDLRRVTKMAYRQIRVYGMNDVIGNLSYDVDLKQGGEFAIKPYSKAMAALIDAEARKIVHHAFAATEKLLRENRSKLELLSMRLLDKEVLTYSDVESLIGAPPFPGKQKIDLAEWEMFAPREGGGSGRGTDPQADIDGVESNERRKDES